MPSFGWSAFTTDQWNSFSIDDWDGFFVDAPTVIDISGSLRNLGNYEYLPGYTINISGMYPFMSDTAFSGTLIDNTSSICQIYKDVGVSGIGTSFNHYLTFVQKSPASNTGYCSVWAVSNAAIMHNQWWSNLSQTVEVFAYAGRLYLACPANYNQTFSNLLVQNQPYYLHINRNNTTYTLNIFNNPQYSGVPSQSLSLTYANNIKYRYFFTINKPYNIGTSNSVALYVDNYILSSGEQLTGTLGLINQLTTEISGVSNLTSFLSLLNMSFDANMSAAGSMSGVLRIRSSGSLDSIVVGGGFCSGDFYAYTAGYTPLFYNTLNAFVNNTGSGSSIPSFVIGAGFNNGYFPAYDSLYAWVGNGRNKNAELWAFVKTPINILNTTLNCYTIGGYSNSGVLDCVIPYIYSSGNKNLWAYSHGF